MKCALFFALLLLLRLLPWGATQSTAPTPTEAASPLPETNGSTCAQWLYGKEPPRVEAFECAGQPDGAQVKFCCGTCGETRNCSVEELAEGTPSRPTDGAPESCPPPPPPTVPHGVRLTWFCTGVLLASIFYWASCGQGRKMFRRKTCAGEQAIELEVSSSVSSPSEHPDSVAASARLGPTSSAGAEGLPRAHGHGSGNVRRIWNPREPAPLQIRPTSRSQPIRGGKRLQADPRKKEVLL